MTLTSSGPLLRCMVVLVVCSMLVPVSSRAAPDDDGRRVDTVPGVVLVHFQAEVAPPEGAAKTGMASFDERAEAFGVNQITRAFPFMDRVADKRGDVPSSIRTLQRIYRLHYTGPERPRYVAAMLAKDPHVAWAEPQYVYQLYHHTTPSAIDAGMGIAEPNDPQFPSQTHLDRMLLPEAWDVVKGEQGDVVIAIVDGGTDWRHPDLQANVWVNPEEIPDNGVDDGNNGFVDDVHGWNFTNETPDPTGVFRTPQNARHGTWAAGAAGAVTNNGEGVAGTSWNAAFMPIGVGCPEIDDNICFGPEGIAYAAANGADIINASFGGPSASDAMKAAVQAAQDLDALVIAAAGNDRRNADVTPDFPSGLPGVLSVGATVKGGDAVASFSNYGFSVDVFAPGTQINTTAPDAQYSTPSGTSFSSPIVAGIAALVKTRFPELSADQLREQLRVTADDINDVNAGLEGRTGRGRVNALRAVTETDNPAIRLTDYAVVAVGGERSEIIEPGETVTITANFVNYLADASDVVIDLVLDDPFATITNGTANVGTLTSGEATTVTFEFDISTDIPKGRLLMFRAEVSAGAYRDADLIAIVGNEAAFATHSSGQLDVSITDEGNIGWLDFADTSLGDGFVIGGRNLLYEGGLLVATGPNAVSDCVRGVDPDTTDHDFIQAPNTALTIFPGDITAEQGEVTLVDATAPNPIGVQVFQESFIDTEDANNDFITLRYTITNTSDARLSNLYAGLFMDWDVAVDAVDAAGYDEQRQFGFVREATAPTTFVGIHLLSTSGQRSYRAIDNTTEIYRNETGGGFTEAEKWNYLKDGIQVKTMGATDVSQLVGTGPFSLEPGASVRVGFALVAGDSEAALLANVDAAQALWDTAVPVEEPAPVPRAFAFEPVYPNPGVTPITLPFHLDAPSQVTMTVYDVLGRAVHTLLDDRRGPGTHRVIWDGRDASGHPVAGGIYFVRLTAEGADRTSARVQSLVLIR